MNKKLTISITAAMLAAMTCVATMIIKVPTPGTGGHINIGDTIVLISCWMLGNPYGALAAGIGSGIADLLSGYALYSPGTTIIKFTMSFIGYIIYKLFSKTKIPKSIAFILSGIVAESIMVAGYFVYEAAFLKYGIVAAVSVPGNIIQGVACLILAIILINAMTQIPYFRSLMQRKIPH